MYGKQLILVVFFLMLLVPVQSSAQSEVSDELANCANIQSDVNRMLCYDQLAKEQKSKTEGGQKKDLSLMVPEERWEKFDNLRTFKLAPYRPTYVLFGSTNKSRNSEPYQFLEPGVELDDTEIKFQLSAQYKLGDDLFWGNGDFWFAYTQLSFWQLYNSDTSSPFRDTNYEPEGFLSFRTNWNFLGLTNRFVKLGFTHESNGRAEPLSRSWNRLYAQFGLERGNFGLLIKPWFWVDEDEDDVDNPEIDNFIGRGQVNLFYSWRKNVFHARWRNNFDFHSSEENHGSIQLDWAFPLYKGLNGYVQYFSGYGESLVDYNVTSETIGIGIIMANWM